MTEEQEQKQEQPVQIKDQVRKLKNACELAKIADGYKVVQELKSRETTVLIENGNVPRKDPVLAQCIEKAENLFVHDHTPDIIELALDMIEQEIEDIRRLVNG